MYKFEEKIQSIDWILIIGIVFAPMTGLRIWKIGPGEILCLCWGSRFFIKMLKNYCYVLEFFLLFLLGMAAGTIAGALIAPRELIFSDWFTWIYLVPPQQPVISKTSLF